MEKTESKHFDPSAKDLAKGAIVAYIAVKALRGVTSVATDTICFVRARKANKALAESK